MKRFLALFMAIALLAVSFAACKKDDGEDTTTTTSESTTAENNTGDGNTVAPTETNATGTNDPTGTSDPSGTDPSSTDPSASDTQPVGGETEPSKKEEPTEKKEDDAPVGSDIAKIVSYYNTAANATKSAGNFRVTKHTVQHLKFEKPSLVAAFANALLKDLDNKVLDRDETFVNGKGTKNTGYTTTGFLPVKDKNHMSQLTANYVQSATCVKDGNNYKVTIKIKNEEVSATSDPPGFSSCMDSITEDIRNVKEVKISSSAKASYSQGEIIAVINPQGKLISLRHYAAATISGDIESGTVSIPFGGKVKNAVVNGDFLAEYKFYW